MDGVRTLLIRLTVCCLIYAPVEALLQRSDRKKGVLESAAKVVALILLAFILGAI